jgi:anti-sigma regulatory factor (Ser/Thr protein kinase)
VTTSHAEPTVVRSLPDEPASVGEARRLVHEITGRLPEQIREDAELAVGELVANAVEHGADGHVTVSARLLASHGIELVVTNPADRPLPAPPWVMPAPTSERGRGLPIVRSVGSEVLTGWDQGTLTVLVRITERPRNDGGT